MFRSLKNLKKISKIKTSSFDQIVNEKKIDFVKLMFKVKKLMF